MRKPYDGVNEQFDIKISFPRNRLETFSTGWSRLATVAGSTNPMLWH